MDKTININLGGSLFQIDEEAFRILRDYLQAINSRFRNVQGGLETIEDIELRIAEIFHSQKGVAGVISKVNVEAMIAIIGKPEDFEQEEFREDSRVIPTHRKRMYRNPDDAIISGVCGGIGAYLETDPVLFRILFVVFAVFFGVGILLYIILWIALPKANTDAKKREMYGTAYHSASSLNSQHNGYSTPTGLSYKPDYASNSRIGNAFNEVFRAIGKVAFIFLRIILIIFGISLVLTGFLTILSIIMVFIFKYPNAFTADGLNVNLAFFPGVLNYIVSPSVTPWIIGLTLAAIILPMLALIYWGIKMIFWFKAKDGLFSLAGFVIWIIVVVVLSIILFNEGISFAESARTTSQKIFPSAPDTLFVMTNQKAADIEFKRKISIPDNDYSLFLVDSNDRIYIRPRLQLSVNEDNQARVEVRKYSSGRTENEAAGKAESLEYNYRVIRDTLYLDEYFKIPEGNKWTADHINIDLSLPENTVIYFDKSAEKLFQRRVRVTRIDHEVISRSVDYNTEPWELRNKYWVISGDGLQESEKPRSK